MGTERRDRSIERILRQPTGAAGVSAAAGPCVDGETLAAWTAGALPQSEAAAVEDHLSHCSRCQLVVAAFARTEPLAPATAAWWQRWQVRWLIPVATAATVAAIYVAIPDREIPIREQSAPQTPAMPQRPTMTQAPRAEATEAPSAEAPPTPQRNATDTLERRRDLQAAAPPASRDAAKSETLAARSERAAATASRKDRDDAKPAPPAAPSAPPAAPSAPPAPAAVAPFAEATGTVEFPSPDKSVRWRIIGGRQVERSIDGGGQWQRVALPAPAILTAGHAPAASIAWLVGRGGAVYLSIDGAAFARVPFPEATDLASVVAVDDRQATVSTVDGRRFATTDGGATWSRR